MAAAGERVAHLSRPVDGVDIGEVTVVAGPVVLLVEDEATARTVATAQLRALGHEVVTAATGAEALEQARRHQPAVVLLDVGLPDTDGHAVLQELKADDRTALGQVLFLSARGEVGEVADGLRAGAVDYLRKPVDPAELEARVGVALRLHAAEAGLRHLALTDALTGLANRRHALDQLDRASSASRRWHLPIGVLLVDVDHFKAVNDTHGHDVGDEVLAEVAARLSCAVREEDLVARWGGEEFLVLTVGVDAGGAVALARRLHRAVADRPVDLADASPLAVTVSVGVAHGGGDHHPLLVEADRALYRAKDQGRDRVETAPVLVPMARTG